MKNKIFLILACLVGSVQAFASGCDTDYCNPCSAPSDCCLDFDSKLTVGLGGGLRWDEISWKTTGVLYDTASSADFRQKWSDIKLGVIEANFTFLACEHYLLKGDFDYGWVYGKSHLSNRFDFEPVNFSSSGFSARSHKGHAYDLSIAIGYQFNWDCYQVGFAPLLGYSYNVLSLNRGDSGIYDTAVSDSSDAHSHKFRLSGPWLGFATTYQATCELLVYLDYGFHWANFRATVDEGLFFDGLVSSVSNRLRSKNVYGNEVTVGGVYTLCDCWFAGLRFDYKNWWASRKHRSDPYSSSFSSSEDSRFRSLTWNSYTLTVDIGYTF